MSRRSWAGALCVVNVGLAIGLAIDVARHLASPAFIGATDFTAFRAGWWLALHDPRHLYDAAAQRAVEQAIGRGLGSPGFVNGMLAFLHPPHMALGGCGIEWLAEHRGGRVAFTLWAACNGLLLARLIQLIAAELAASATETLFVAATLVGFLPVVDTFRQGQLSLLLAVSASSLVVAVRRGRWLAAAACLLVLSLKPQILPMALVVLAVRREWRTLAAATALGAGVAIATAAVLGPRVWIDYASRVGALERMFGGGPPSHMPALRGLLARLLPHGSEVAVERIALVGWLAGLAVSGLVLARRRRDGLDDARVDFAFAFALGWATSPHFYAHDVVLWVVPVVLILAGERAEGGPARHRLQLVLAWPLWFLMSRIADGGGIDPRWPVDPTLIPLAIALIWATRAARRVSPVSARLPPA